MVGRRESAIALMLLLCVVVIPAVVAIGISHEYLEEKTMELAPGDNYYFKLTIQNKENESVTVNVSLKSEIARIVGGGTITVPPEDYDEFVYFNITVPEDAEPGTIYDLDYKVLPVGRGDGMVPFAIAYSRTIKVRVSGTPRESPAAAVEAPSDVTRVLQPAVEQPRPLMSVILIAGLLLIIAAVIAMVWQRSGQVVLAMKRRRKPKHQPEQTETVATPQATTTTQPAPVQAEATQAAPPVVPQQPTAAQPISTQPMPAATPMPEQKARLSAIRAAPDQAFNLHDGRAFRDIPGLLFTLETMDENTFLHHTGQGRNDFSAWLHHALGQPELAARIAALPDRPSMIKVLQDALG